MPSGAKLCIGSLDPGFQGLQVRAQYNPKELQIDRSLTWEEHKGRNNQSQNNDVSSPRVEGSDQSDLEFKGAGPRSMTVEMLFDRYEEGESVEPDILVLEELAAVQVSEATARDEVKKRPHHCVVTWGNSPDGMRPFRCVIESLAVKYTMWDRAGTPVRATCTVKLKEAQKMAHASGP
jgi:hypothetical protein